MSIALETREQIRNRLKFGRDLKIVTQVRATRWLWLPLLLFTITRAGIILVAYLAVPLLAESTSPPPYHLRGTDNLLLDVFGSRWDTGFYVSIAEEGYMYEGVDLPSVAFFPLLPLMMRALTPFTGDPLVAGILISNIALLLASVLLYRLVVESRDRRLAERTTWYFLIFPAAFFGIAVYTESLFLLFAIGALYFARRGYWEIAALLGIAGSMTRLMGLIIAVMLLVEWWQQRRAMSGGRRPSPVALAAPAAVPLGTLAFMAFLWRAFGDPLAFVHGAAAWAREPQSPLELIAGLLQSPAGGWGSALLAGRVHFNDWLDFAFVVLFLILGLVLFYQKRWSEGAFVTLGVLLSISSGLLMSQRRYMWVLFPAFIILAKWGDRPWIDKLITTTSLVLLAIFTALYANGYWVG